ncbi:very-long-chain 3-oxoacyl-CoA reductase [Aspergillus varians]
MEFLKDIASSVSDWEFNFAPGWQSVSASVLLTAGSWFVVSRVWTFVRVLANLFILPGKSLRSFGPKGSWAIVTGASDGLGKEYALQIARAGYNIVLVSRTASKLTTLTDEITSKYPSVQTKMLAMDFARNEDQDYEKLRALVEDLDVAILVNNVGKSHSIPVPFALTPEDEMSDIITINCTGTLRVTHLVVPGMIQRKRGLILTMGSFGGLVPTPLLATYSGSKAFLQQWSTALGSELQPHGITVELVQAYLITSAMSKVPKTSALIPNPRVFVQAALSKIGNNGGSPTYAYSSSPYWSHGLVAYVATCVANPMSKWLGHQNKGMHESIRKRALRKAERENSKKSS